MVSENVHAAASPSPYSVIRGWSKRPSENFGYVYTLRYATIDGTAWQAGVEAVPLSIERKCRRNTGDTELSLMIADSFYAEKYKKNNNNGRGEGRAGGPYAIPFHYYYKLKNLIE
jgi:hypothetical protein